MNIEADVRLRGISPQIALAITVAWTVYQTFGCSGMTVTSGTEGAHKRASLHYTGNAIDLRIWNVPEIKRADLVAALCRALGSEYDAILEADHIHVEYQPKDS